MLSAAFFLLLACAKPIPDTPVPAGTLVFHLSANYPNGATKAVKTAWENGDVVFVFIDQVPSPQYVKMCYNGSGWTSQPMNEDQAVTSWGIDLDGKTLTMRAVYRPFGSDDYVEDVNDNGSYLFHEQQDSYYLTAQVTDVKVSKNQVTAEFNMSLATDDFVQFFVADPYAVDRAYVLKTDAVLPYQLVGVNADLSLSDMELSLDYGMTGYAYAKAGSDKGYVFSGKRVSGYATAYGTNFYFAKTSLSANVRTDYLVQGKTLNEKASIILPPNGDDRWKTVNSSTTVDLGEAGVWYTCDYGPNVPEMRGNTHTFAEATSQVSASVRALPSGDQLTALLALEHFPMSIGGHTGNVFKSESDFMFLPAGVEYYYWGAAVENSSTAWRLYSGRDDLSVGSASNETQCSIRYVTAN